MDNQTTQPMPERPNLEQQSVAFETVKGVGLGALSGGVMGLTVNAISHFSPSSLRFKNSELGWLMAILGVLDGSKAADKASQLNAQNARVKPYVEKLERELLAKNATADTPAPQR